MEDAPQVHVHFLTEEDEYRLTGFWKVELCCHGCGKSQLVYYNDANKQKHLAIRDAFAEKHQDCPDRGFAEYCVDYRSGVATIDLRRSRRTRPVTRTRVSTSAGRRLSVG